MILNDLTVTTEPMSSISVWVLKNGQLILLSLKILIIPR